MQAKGQLWPTRAFSAECAQNKQQVREKALNTSWQEGGRLLIKKATLMIKPSKPPQGGEGKTVQPGFARGKCTPSAYGTSPGGGGSSGSMPCDAYEGNASLRFVVPPLAGERWCRKAPKGESCRRQLFSVFPSRQRRGCMVLSKETAALFKRPPTAGPKGPSEV